MKKIFSFVITFLGISFCFAQNVENVSIKFCDNISGDLTSRSAIAINPGENKELCLYMENQGEQPANIKYSFPLGKLTNWGTQVCDTSTGFERFFPDPRERSVLLSGHSHQTIRETLQVPLGMSGMIYGCMTYIVEQPSDQEHKMFTVVVRKATFINLLVGGSSAFKKEISLLPLTGGFFSDNSKIKAEVNTDNTIILSFLVKNKGNITQNIALSGLIYNFLGFQKDFDGGEKKLIPGELYEFKIPVGMIPSYKGLYDVRFALSAVPFFDFSPQGLDPQLLEPIFLEETAKIFIFSWIRVIILLVIIALIVKFFWPRSRKIEKIVLKGSEEIKEIPLQQPSSL